MATKKSISKSKAPQISPIEQLGQHIRELTAIQAHTDALALAVPGKGEFRDGELSAILFDLDERLIKLCSWIPWTVWQSPSQ